MKYLNEYDLQANNFLAKAGTTLEITFVETVSGFPFDSSDHYNRNKYSCKLRRNGKTYTFSFYDSVANYRNNERPTKYDVLACIEKYPVDPDVWGFASDFGYQISSKEDYTRVSKIHRECKKQFNKLLALFGPDLMEELQEIC